MQLQRLVSTCIFLFASFLATNNTKAQAQAKDTEPAIAATKMNILYVGMDNPLRIAVPEYTCKELIVSISNGEIKGSGCDYAANACRIGEAIVLVKTVKGKDTVLLGTLNLGLKGLRSNCGLYSVTEEKDPT